jgi:hypothetical protein
MIKFTRKPSEQEDLKGLVTADDILTIVENNRARIRALSEQVLTVCGLLLSASFVVLFFVLTDTKFSISWLVPLFLFGTSASLTFAIIFSVLSVHLPTPTAVPTKLELIDLLTAIYYREYRRAVISIVFLILAIILFAIALGVFGASLL